MSLTAEIRWFWPHPAPASFAVWFRSAARHGCAAGGGRLRSDSHWVWAAHPRWDLGPRAGAGLHDSKALIETIEGGCAIEPLAGDVSLWLTQSAARPAPHDAVAVELTGRRWLRQFDTSGGQVQEVRLDAQGQPLRVQAAMPDTCLAEYAEFELGLSGERWATTALVAAGTPEHLLASLRRTATLLAARKAPPLSDALPASYPEWLGRMGSFWRPMLSAQLSAATAHAGAAASS